MASTYMQLYYTVITILGAWEAASALGTTSGADRGGGLELHVEDS